MKVGVAIPTLNAEKELCELLSIVKQEPGISEILVIDSASSDGTVDVAKRFDGVRVVSIEKSEFNHGGTREKARKLLGTDVVVFLTQDVIPKAGFLGPLLQPILDGEAAVSYSRQIPHEGADVFEAFPRTFNYPLQSQRRTLADTKEYGVYTFFCSDSCSAYLNTAVDEIGGIEPILTNEDYFTVAKLLRKGYAVFYAAESVVHHSHGYTLLEEFQRYFDTGYVRGTNPWVNKLVGQAERRGAGFVRAFIAKLLHDAPWLIPYAVIQVTMKWAGYRIGTIGRKLPIFVCRMLSQQKYYWKNSASQSQV